MAKEVCPACGGTGEIVPDPKNPFLRMICKQCGGTGEIDVTDPVVPTPTDDDNKK